jgi:hypothetical protein
VTDVKLVHGLSISLEENDEQGRYNNTDDKYEIPEIADLNSGWTGDKFGIPAVTHNGVQEYLSIGSLYIYFLKR